jgi:hypothetical protein
LLYPAFQKQSNKPIVELQIMHDTDAGFFFAPAVSNGDDGEQLVTLQPNFVSSVPVACNCKAAMQSLSPSEISTSFI